MVQKSINPLLLMDNKEVIQQQADQSSLTERYMEKATDFIRKNKEESFFLYLAHMHVHVPHYAPKRFIEASENGQYGASVGCIDWSLEVILHELKQNNLEEDTLVVFTSDNGSNLQLGGSNGDLRGAKATTWEGGQRVPCIMYWPGTIEKGQVCRDIVTSLEFMPTLYALDQGSMPQDRIIDGVDISGLITKSDNYIPRETFFYYRQNVLEGVRHRNLKLTVRRGDETDPLLFDLEQDISERHNLYEEMPHEVLVLEKMLQSCRQDMGDSATGIVGMNNRSIGRVANPRTLTTYDPDHPYIVAMYDKSECG